MITIGTYTLSVPFVAAPLSGISDLPYRLLIRSFGCELAFTEMISARGLAYHDKKTLELLKTCDADRPLGIQLLGSNAELLCRSLDVLAEIPHDIIDLNAACPVPKVIKKGEGASLMKDPKKLHDLLKRIVAKTTKPVTVKIRAGWDHRSVNAVEIARSAQDAGIAALFVHGRTMTQGYHGSVDYGVIRAVKEAVSIPVFGSGDVLSPLHAHMMISKTGCDGVVVARGALGNPWIFQQIAAFLTHGTLIETPSLEKVVQTMVQHLNACCDLYGERHGAVVFRKFFVWYTKGIAHIRALRNKAFHAATRADMLDIIGQISP
ncbi:MAG: tRNA dihydrouridine synthase DusB [Desulfobacterota bacterium]|nr:tRNA dihydrouridine synthase DusB [Thermodesulfobacteriota bacterium]